MTAAVFELRLLRRINAYAEAFRRIRSQIAWILFAVDPAPVEVGTGFVAATVGSFLVLPLNTFASAPGYATMAWLAPEWLWGIWFLSAGVLQFFGPARGHTIERRIAAAMLVFAWTFMAAAIGNRNSYSIAIALFPALAALSWWVYQRADD